MLRHEAGYNHTISYGLPFTMQKSIGGYLSDSAFQMYLMHGFLRYLRRSAFHALIIGSAKYKKKQSCRLEIGVH